MTRPPFEREGHPVPEGDFVCTACLTDHDDRDDAAACCGAGVLVASGAGRSTTRQGPKPRGPDWAERNPEAADLEAARNRQRVIENAVNKGRF